MKFSDLNSLQRSLLAALASAVGSTLHTGQLAGYCGNDAQKAAHQLCALRDAGLIFSHQKPAGQQYAKWQISLVGMAVFEGRPDGEVLLVPAGAQEAVRSAALAQDEPKIKEFKVYALYASGTAKLVCRVEDTEEGALAVLARVSTENPGTTFELRTAIATAHLPKPQATITRV